MKSRTFLVIILAAALFMAVPQAALAHHEIHDHVHACASQLLGGRNIVHGKPSMGSEDFAYFTSKWPGMMVWCGCRKPEEEFRYGLHSPYFDMDEAVLPVAVELFTEIITRFLEKTK